MSTDKDDSRNALDTSAAGILIDILARCTSDNLFIIQIKDGEFYLHWANCAMEKAAGKALEGMKGLSIQEILGRERSAKVIQNYQHCAASKKPFEYQEEAIDGDGNIRYWQTLLTPQIGDHGEVQFLSGVSRDITAIVQAKQNAEFANKTKTEFLARMSHDVNTPLNSIGGAITLLQKLPLQDNHQRLLSAISAAALTIEELTTDILCYSKLEAGALPIEYGPLSLRQLVEDVIVQMEIDAQPKDVTLKLDAQISGDRRVGDKKRLTQILCNLISNGIKYSSQCRSPLITLSVATKDKEVCFQVEDNGIGIAEEDYAHLFKPYSRLNEAKASVIPGTGLGLAIVHDLVSAMDGTISVESTVGQGSLFTVNLPMEVSDAIGQQPQFDNIDTITTGKRLLFVDDDRVTRMFAEELFPMAGYELDVAHSGHEALTLLRQKSYDLILIDWHMPELNGLETARLTSELMAEKGDKTLIMGMSADKTQTQIQQWNAVGVSVIVEKPITDSNFMAEIKRHASGT